MAKYFSAIVLILFLTAMANPAHAARLSFNDDHNFRHDDDSFNDHRDRFDNRQFRFDDHNEHDRWVFDEHWNDFFNRHDDHHDRDFRGRFPFEFYAFEHDHDHHGRDDNDDFGFHFRDRHHHHEFSRDWHWMDRDWRWRDAHNWHHHPGDPGEPLATPLPASWLLFGTGLLLFAGYVRMVRAKTGN